MDISEVMKARYSVRQYSGRKIEQGEKLACIIAPGYGSTQGIAHQNKPMEQLCNCASGMPDSNEDL